jgi:hypothetical protein
LNLTLRDIIFGGSIQKGMGWAGNLARMGENRYVYVAVADKAEGKRLLGRSRRNWKDNINCVLKK